MSPCHHHPIAPHRWLRRAKLGCGDAGGGTASSWQGGGHCLPFPRGLQVAPFLRGVAAVPCRRQPALLCADLWGELSEALGENPPLRGVLDALCLCMGVGCLDSCSRGCSRWSREEGRGRPGRMGAPPLWEAEVSGRGACSTLEALQARLTPRISAWMTEEAFAGSRWDVASPPRQQGAFLAAPSCAPGYPHPHPDAAVAFPRVRGTGDPSPC